MGLGLRKAGATSISHSVALRWRPTLQHHVADVPYRVARPPRRSQSEGLHNLPKALHHDVPLPLRRPRDLNAVNRQRCAIRNSARCRFARTLSVVKHMTRSRLIQAWFATISLIVVAAVALDVTVTTGTAVVLLALSLIAPAILLVLWPSVQPATAADVLHGRDPLG